MIITAKVFVLPVFPHYRGPWYSWWGLFICKPRCLAFSWQTECSDTLLRSHNVLHAVSVHEEEMMFAYGRWGNQTDGTEWSCL